MRRSTRKIELPPAPAEGRISAPRSFRPRERVRRRPRQQGRIVIRALVRGRLLGLKILTLDACVVVGGDYGPAAVVPVPLLAAGLDVNYRSAAHRPNSPAPGSGTSLAYAMQLLEQGAHTLEQSRRLRLGDVGLSWPEGLRPRQELWGLLLLVSSGTRSAYQIRAPAHACKTTLMQRSDRGNLVPAQRFGGADDE